MNEKTWYFCPHCEEEYLLTEDYCEDTDYECPMCGRKEVLESV